MQRRVGDAVVSVVENDGVIRARGIRYGRAERFESPEPVGLDGEIDASRPGPVCPQRPSRLGFVTGPVLGDLRFDEDCLVVSVTAPVDADGAPVMVWFHGGAYVAGGGESPKYDATTLVRGSGVVVVSVTYRLGVFGYLSPLADGDVNLGLRDQILALEWVREHIASFGGDPADVTVFGQSAGADSVLALLLCEDAVGFFRRAVVQSAPLGVGTQNTAVDRSALVSAMRAAMTASLSGVDPRAADRGRLLAAEGAAVVAAQDFGILGGLAFAPLLGHAPLPAPEDVARRLAEAAPRVELLIGYTTDDGSPFVAMNSRVKALGRMKAVEKTAIRAATPLITRRVFSGPVAAFAESWRANGGRVATYRFGWRPAGAPFGACHCMELPLLFDSDAWADAPMLGGDPVDPVLAARMRSLWTAFARDGVAALPSESLSLG